MQLSQYVYGRKPAIGLGVIARSGDLPFYKSEWLNEARYGSAPMRETPDRIWIRRYEIQSFSEGIVISCLYPLKQTEVPCNKQEPPYAKGITPAVHHLLLGKEDSYEAMKKPERLVFFDDFFDIDAIYSLPSGHLPLLEYPVAGMHPCRLNDEEKTVCASMLPFVWRAFLARKSGELSVLYDSRVLLIVPSCQPDEELAIQRHWIYWLLMGLPPHMRVLCSYTLNVDAESDNLPRQSALYGMIRVNEESMPSVSGKLFDLERHCYDQPASEEATYFQERLQGDFSPLADDALYNMEGEEKYDLGFCIQFHYAFNLIVTRRSGCTKEIKRLYERLSQNQRCIISETILSLLLEPDLQTWDEEKETVIWTVFGLFSEFEIYDQADMMKLALAIPAEKLVKLALHPCIIPESGIFPIQTAVFCSAVAEKVSELPTEPYNGLCINLVLWLERTQVPHNYVNDITRMARVLVEKYKEITHDVDNLLRLLEIEIFHRSELSVLGPFLEKRLVEFSTKQNSRLLLQSAKSNHDNDHGNPLEKQLLNAMLHKQETAFWEERDLQNITERITSCVADAQTRVNWAKLLLESCEKIGAIPQVMECEFIIADIPELRNAPLLSVSMHRITGTICDRYLQEAIQHMPSLKSVVLFSEIWKKTTKGISLSNLSANQWRVIKKHASKVAENAGLEEMMEIPDLEDYRIQADWDDFLSDVIEKRAYGLLNEESPVQYSADEIVYLYKMASRRTYGFSHSIRYEASSLVAFFLLVKDTGNMWFLDYRSKFVRLSEEYKHIVISVLGKHFINEKKENEEILILQNLQGNNSMDWPKAFLELMRLNGITGEEPYNPLKWDEARKDQFVSLLVRLYSNDTNEKRKEHTILLNANDQQQLADYLYKNNVKMVKWLLKESKRNEDFPEEVHKFLLNVRMG